MDVFLLYEVGERTIEPRLDQILFSLKIKIVETNPHHFIRGQFNYSTKS